MKKSFLTKKKVKLEGVIGPQTLADCELISLFTDNEKEYPIVKNQKSAKLVSLIGQRVEVEGELIYDWKKRELEIKVNHFRLKDLEDFDPMIRTNEPPLPFWELMPYYA